MKIFVAKFVVSAVFVFLIAACDATASPGNQELKDKAEPGNTKERVTEIFEVADRRAYCSGVVPRKCLQVKRKGRKNFKTMYDEIENFKFIPGYMYVLKVEVERMKFTPKDTSGYKYYLKEIVSREKVTDPDKHAELYLRRWKLISIQGKRVEDSRPYLLFDKDKGSFGGSTGCNSVRGKFKVDDDAISFSAVRQTKRACPDMQEIEFPFTSSLAKADKLKTEIDRLYLYADGKIVLEFRPTLDP